MGFPSCRKVRERFLSLRIVVSFHFASHGTKVLGSCIGSVIKFRQRKGGGWGSEAMQCSLKLFAELHF